MKTSLIKLIPAITLIFFMVSCSKNDTPPATPVGIWVGTGQYGTTPGNPTYLFKLTFNANGTVDIMGDNSTAIDNATGTWAIVQDSVKATYIYASGSAQYTLSGKFSSGSNVMAGTIGLGTSTTGVGLFSVTKQ